MNRRTLVVAAVVVLVSAFAHAAEPAREKGDALPLAERRLDLRALFDRGPGVVREDANGITVTGSDVSVVLVRIDADGKLVTACVDTEEAARRFLEAPAGQIDARQQKER